MKQKIKESIKLKDLKDLKVFTIPVESIRSFNENLGEPSEQLTFNARVLVQDVPDGIWMDTNPREQKFSTNVAKKIENSLINRVEDDFHLLNRGILISAFHARVIENEGKKYLEIYLKDRELHGNVDGGHTYKLICKNKDQIQYNKKVVFEVMTGIEDIFEELAAARNTSVQVQEKSIAELQNKFDIIKNAIRKESFFKNISFKENEEGRIDISDIIAILTMFNLDRYDDDKQPIISYSSKKKCIDLYLEDYEKEYIDNPYFKMKTIMPDIFNLLDYIETNIGDFYNKTGGKYGAIKGVGYNKKNGEKGYPRVFKGDNETMKYSSPKGFTYPILNSFRSLVVESNGTYEWVLDPIEVFDEIGIQLVKNLMDTNKALGNNPNATGKYSGLWEQLYQKVDNYYLKKISKMLK